MKQYLLLGALVLINVVAPAQENLNLLFSQERYEDVISQLEPMRESMNIDECYALATAYFQSGMINNTIDLLKSIKEELPPKHKDLLCKSYFETGQYPEALTICRQRYAKDPDHYGNLMRYAQIQNIEGEYDSTICILNHYLTVDSLNYNANMLLAETYQKALEDLLAIKVYNKILMQYPTNQKVGCRLGQAYYGKKKYVECFDLSMHFVDTLGYSKRFLTMAALASFKSGANGNTVKLFKRMEAKGDSSFITKKHIGIAYYRMENYDLSLPYLYAAFDMKDDDPEVCFFLGASLGQSSTPLRGKPYLEMAAMLISPSPDLMGNIHLKLALIHEDSGNFTKAIAHYDSAYRFSPDAIQYLYNQAVIYDYNLDSPQKAQELYERFLSSLPDTLDSKKGNDLYKIRLKEIVDNRLNTMAEDQFFREGI